VEWGRFFLGLGIPIGGLLLICAALFTLALIAR